MGYSYYLIVFFCIMTSSVVFFVSHAGATSFTNHLKILLIFIRVVMNLLSPIPNICWNILKWFAISYFWTTTIFVPSVYGIKCITICFLVDQFTMIWLSSGDISILMYCNRKKYDLWIFLICIYIYNIQIYICIIFQCLLINNNPHNPCVWAV